MQPQKDNRAPNLTQQHPCETRDSLDFNFLFVFFILAKTINIKVFSLYVVFEGEGDVRKFQGLTLTWLSGETWARQAK